MEETILSLQSRIADHEKRIRGLEQTISDLKDAVLNLQNRPQQPPQPPESPKEPI
jgi:hypothetical protein